VSILLVCVNYGHDQETVGFVRSVAGLVGAEDVHVVVVDNADAPAPIGPLVELTAAPRVTVLAAGTNLGYLRGAEWGRRRYLEDAPDVEWVIVSNTDIEFCDPHVLQKLTTCYGGSRPTPGVIAPDIELVPDRGPPLSPRHQNPYMVSRPAASSMRALTMIMATFAGYRLYEGLATLRGLYRYHRGSTSDGPRAGEIYAPFGAFMIFHRSFFECGATLDGAPFMYGEELYVAEVARKHGVRIVFDPSLRVIHRQHFTIDGSSSRRRAEMSRDSLRAITDSFFR